MLQFRFVPNPGAAFSLAIGFTWIFSIVAAGVVVHPVVRPPHPVVRLGVMFGLLLGGMLGNLTDRLFREPSFGLGHVIDFIQVWGFPAIFNVADIAIVSSMGLFILLTIRGVGLDGIASKRTDAGRGGPRRRSRRGDADGPAPLATDAPLATRR